jgi:protein SCO1
MLEGRKATARRAAVAVLCCAMVACTAPEGGALELDPPQPAPDFTARGADGHAFQLSAHRGKVVVLSFGYTSCPDVCPTTLSRLRTAYRELGARADQVSVVFLTVDPERDSPERLRPYLAAFEPRFEGAVLEGEALHTTLERYGITAVRRIADARRYRALPGAADAAPPYSIDHTGGYLVIDREGALRLRYPHQATAQQLVSGLQRLLDEEA